MTKFSHIKIFSTLILCYQKVGLKNRFLTPRDLEFQISDDTEVEKENVFVIPTTIPQREKIVAYAAAANYPVYKQEV